MSTARLASITTIADEVAEVDLVAIDPAALDFVPGQHVCVDLPGVRERRAYSIASPPGRRDGVTLLVRERGRTAAVWRTLAPGAELSFDGPRGDFRLDEADGRDAVLVATGVGIAPLFPMMESALARGGAGRVRLFWGLDRAEEHFWPERLARLASDARFAARSVVAGLGQGFVTAAVLAAAPGFVDPTYYLCGNVRMVRDVTDGLVAAGVDAATRIRSEV